MNKSYLTFLLTAFIFTLFTKAQSQTIPPPFINYQAVLYDVTAANPNNPLINQSFTTFVNINDELGNLLYREEHYASTDANGLITVKMGDGLYTAGPITNFNQIDWGVGKYYLVVDFVINGTTSSTAPEQLVTVPYSFYAGKAGNGMTAVADNGNGTLTFTYANGATYTTPTLAGIQGPVGPSGTSGPSGPQGVAGQSAYDLWLGQGNTGTVQDFLSTSAYQIWLAQGNTGTAQDFLNTLVGPAGPQGTQGIQGIPGTNGATGPQGIQGIAGVNGVNGTDGRSAYEIAVLNGFVGTETQWLLSLVGATGPVGAPGAQGLQGPAGNDGATGQQGPIGLTGATGPQGIQGPAGAIGATGPQGPIGLTGSIGVTGPAGTNGTSGLNALIKTTTEPAGANCTNGGTKIETGLDANGNGALDNGEVNASQTKYVCNGTSASSSGGLSNQVYFSTNGNWTVPTGVTKIQIEAWGAGGGGGGATGGSGGYINGCSFSKGGNGGTGGYVNLLLIVNPGENIPVTIGSGGNGGATGSCPGVCSGTPGTSGGNTSFGNYLTANGGTGGQAGSLGGACGGGNGGNGSNAPVIYTYTNAGNAGGNININNYPFLSSLVPIVAKGGVGGQSHNATGGLGEPGFILIRY